MSPLLLLSLSFSRQQNISPPSSAIARLVRSGVVGLTEYDKQDELVMQYLNNRALDVESLAVLGVVYTVMILIGAIGNGLVAFVVLNNASMRTPRNLYIANLAISDLLLCFFTIPFSLLEISVKFWPYGMCLTLYLYFALSEFIKMTHT